MAKKTKSPPAVPMTDFVVKVQCERCGAMSPKWAPSSNPQVTQNQIRAMAQMHAQRKGHVHPTAIMHVMHMPTRKRQATRVLLQ